MKNRCRALFCPQWSCDYKMPTHLPEEVTSEHLLPPSLLSGLCQALSAPFCVPPPPPNSVCNVYSLCPPAVWNALPWILGSEIWPAAPPLTSRTMTPTACWIAKIQLMQLDSKTVDHTNISIRNRGCVFLCWCWGYMHVLQGSCILMRRTVLAVFSFNDVFQKQKVLVVKRRKSTVGKRRCVMYQLVWGWFAFQMGTYGCFFFNFSNN